jgi:predicted RNA-binding protein (virulence factor B family)
MDIGKINELEVIDIRDKEVILNGGDEGNLTVSKREFQQEMNVGDKVEVFVTEMQRESSCHRLYTLCHGW